MRYTKEQVVEFATTLSTTEPYLLTKDDLSKIARFINSDGCTMVVDICWEACVEHDFYYTTKMHLDGRKISRAEADELFREAIQRYSVLGEVSPLSVWRWMAVRSIGWIFWKRK